MKNVLLYAVMLAGLLSFTACKKEKNGLMLDGPWIEQNHRTDTLIFQRSSGILMLNRPKVMNGQHLLPKKGAGMYLFKDLKDSIQLQYSLSSLYRPTSYSYRIVDGKLYLHDFYDGSAAMIVYERLK